MDILNKPFTFDRVVRLAIGVLITIALFVFVKSVSAALLPFLIGWLIAYMVNPIVGFYQRLFKMRSRFLPIVLAFFSIIATFTLIGLIIVPPINEEIAKITGMLSDNPTPKGYIPFIPIEWQDYLIYNVDWQQLVRYLNKSDWTNIIKEALPQVWSFVDGSISFVVGFGVFFVTMLYAFFILADFEEVSEGALRIIPPRYRERVNEVLEDMEEAMNKYFRGQFVVASSVGVLMAVGFWIIDLPLGILLGLFIGLLNMVPYLQIAGFVPGALLCVLKAMETGDSFWLTLLLMTGVICIVQVIQDTVIVPKVMGKVTGMNAALILLSLSIWGSLLGMVGMIIALPMTTLIISYYKRFVLEETVEKRQSIVPTELPGMEELE